MMAKEESTVCKGHLAKNKSWIFVSLKMEKHTFPSSLPKDN